MDILAYFLAVLIGVSIGLVGSGGSIMAVPILVYLFKLDPMIATGYSLFIVGASSLTGGVVKAYRNLVDFKMVAIIGLPSLIMVLITRIYIMPQLPDILWENDSLQISKSLFIMLFFAIIMIIASYSMIKAPESTEEVSETTKSGLYVPFVLMIGIALGVVTGMVGAGGGFLIVPSLVLVMRTPIHKAIGTSMWIVAINSLLGFSGYLITDQASIDWQIIVYFTAASIVGIVIGLLLSRYISGERLKKGFGYFILIMGAYILLTELLMSA